MDFNQCSLQLDHGVELYSDEDIALPVEVVWPYLTPCCSNLVGASPLWAIHQDCTHTVSRPHTYILWYSLESKTHSEHIWSILSKSHSKHPGYMINPVYNGTIAWEFTKHFECLNCYVNRLSCMYHYEGMEQMQCNMSERCQHKLRKYYLC